MCGQVAAVTLGADPMFRLTGQHRADFNRFNRRLIDAIGSGIVDFITGLDDNLPGGGIHNVVNRHTAKDTLAQRSHNLIVVLDFTAYKASQCAAILFADNDIVGNIYQTTCQITCVGSLQRRVGKTLTGTVSRDKVFQHAQPLLEVRQNRVLDNLATFRTGFLRLSHQTTHTGQLTDLVFRSTRT